MNCTRTSFLAGVRLAPAALLTAVFILSPLLLYAQSDAKVTVVETDVLDIPFKEEGLDRRLLVENRSPETAVGTLVRGALRIQGVSAGEARIQLVDKTTGQKQQVIDVTVTPADRREIKLQLTVGSTLEVSIEKPWAIDGGDAWKREVRNPNVVGVRSRHSKSLTVTGLSEGLAEILMKCKTGTGQKRRDGRWTYLIRVGPSGATAEGPRTTPDVGDSADGGADNSLSSEGDTLSPEERLVEDALSDPTSLRKLLEVAPGLRETMRRRMALRGLDLDDFDDPPECGADSESRRRALNPMKISIGVRSGLSPRESDVTSFEPLHFDVRVPREDAVALGSSITVTLRSELGGDEETLVLERAGGERDVVLFTNQDAVQLAQGTKWSSIGPLPIWTLLPLTTLNGDTLTVSFGDASTTRVVYDTGWQRNLAEAQEVLGVLSQFYAAALSTPGISQQVQQSAHAKMKAAQNVLSLLERDGLNDVRKVRLAESYLDLLQTDATGWRRADSPEARLLSHGIVLGSQQEHAAVDLALELAREDIAGFHDAAVIAVLDGAFDVATNVTGINQASMVLFGKDSRGRSVSLPDRFLAGIDLATRIAVLGSSMSSSGGAFRPPGAIPPRPPKGARPNAPKGVPKADGLDLGKKAVPGNLKKKVPEAADSNFNQALDLADLGNFGLPNRTWAREFLANQRLLLESNNAWTALAAKSRLQAVFFTAPEMRAAMTPATLARVDAAVRMLERLVDAPAWRGAFSMDQAYLQILLRAADEKVLAPMLAVEGAITNRVPGASLTIPMIQNATGFGRAASGQVLRRVADRLNLTDADLRRLNIEVPTRPKGLFRDPGSGGTKPGLSGGGAAAVPGVGGALLPRSGNEDRNIGRAPVTSEPAPNPEAVIRRSGARSGRSSPAPLGPGAPRPASPLPAPEQRVPAPERRTVAPQQRTPAPEQRVLGPERRVTTPQQRVPAPVPGRTLLGGGPNPQRNVTIPGPVPSPGQSAAPAPLRGGATLVPPLRTTTIPLPPTGPRAPTGGVVPLPPRAAGGVISPGVPGNRLLPGRVPGVNTGRRAPGSIPRVPGPNDLR